MIFKFCVYFFLRDTVLQIGYIVIHSSVNVLLYYGIKYVKASWHSIKDTKTLLPEGDHQPQSTYFNLNVPDRGVDTGECYQLALGPLGVSEKEYE